MKLEWDWRQETGFPGFLAATVDQARRVLDAEGNDQTYEAGTYFAGLAAAGLSVSCDVDELSEVSGALALIWGELTDAMDAPGTGSPEQDVLAVRQMKRASAEWLEVVHLPERRSSYLDHWVHDECGYAR
ncbi:hypothetical protein ACPCHT_38640 [Nucisporomicrobium flavum]|uniref:hypothetical protein n=1 Tax=Nucisporomicrobium flavum TaxID=2785915 RepID=UPI0018F646CA|nr:hypothetical protein [Nucisporomicrobium flavum]